MAERTRWTRGCPHCANSTCRQAGKSSSRSERRQRSTTKAPHPTTPQSLHGALPPGCVRRRTQRHMQATARAGTPPRGPSRVFVWTLSRWSSRARSPILLGTPIRWQRTAGLQNVATTTLGHARWSRDGATVVVAATGGVVIPPNGAGGERARRARSITRGSHSPPIRRLADTA